MQYCYRPRLYDYKSSSIIQTEKHQYDCKNSIDGLSQATIHESNITVRPPYKASSRKTTKSFVELKRRTGLDHSVGPIALHDANNNIYIFSFLIIKHDRTQNDTISMNG